MSASAGKVLMIPKGEYDATATYTMLDVVSYQGKSYVAKQTTTGNAPTDTTYWQLMIDAQGHTIKDSTTIFPNRANLVFDGFFISDDAQNNATIIQKEYIAPSWANGTDEEIIEALNLHYAGVIDLHDYWTVGDERRITLSAMEATPSGIGESHAASTVTFVLMNAGGKTLYNERTNCAFVVGMKEALGPGGVMGNSNLATWFNTVRRTWCNTTFREAIPSSIRGIFKQHINKYSKPGGGVSESVDYFALPGEREVVGSSSFSSNDGDQFDYYKTAANKKKIWTTTGAGTYKQYWTRSSWNDSDGGFVYITSTGAASVGGSTGVYGLSPFGCI